MNGRSGGGLHQKSDPFEIVKNLAKEFFRNDLIIVTGKVFEDVGEMNVVIKCRDFDDWRAKTKAFKEALREKIGEEWLGKIAVICFEGLR